MTPNHEQKPHYQIRSIQHYDYREVLRIQRSSFPYHWSFRELDKALAQPFVRGLLIDRRDFLTALEEETVGFCIYSYNRSFVKIDTIAVAPEFRQETVGGKLLRFILNDLRSVKKFKRVTAVVRESSLPAQLLFRSQGLKCIETVRNAFNDTDEDGYKFVLRLQETQVGKESVNVSTQSPT